MLPTKATVVQEESAVECQSCLDWIPPWREKVLDAKSDDLQKLYSNLEYSLQYFTLLL